MKYEPVYIYALIDPRDEKIRYIGQSIKPDKRYEQHLNEIETNPGKIGWINGLEIRGLKPEMKILEVANEKTWQDRERWWIERGREFGWPLLNIAPGGEGNYFYQLPSSLYWLLPKPTLEQLEALPHKIQADIVIRVAKKIADGFVEMVNCYVNEDYQGYFRLQHEGRVTVIKEIKSEIAVKTRLSNKES
jgi:hypothetical protein